VAHIFEAPVLQISRFYSGLYTFRNPLVVPIRQMGRRIIELYDALIAGSNMEITNTLTLKRRPGYTSFNSNNVSGVPLAFYSFKPTSVTGQVFPIVDTTADVEYVPPGSTAITQILAKTDTNQTNFCGIGPYLYMGNPSFSKKWDGPNGAQGVTNWGIAIGSVNAAIGPNTAGLGQNGAGSPAWANPNNVTSAVNFATVTVTSGQGASVYLRATTFGFAIPSTTTITGIQVTFDAISNPASSPTFPYIQAFLTKDGANISGNVKLNFPGTVVSTLNAGGQNDLWGNTITASDTNQTTFGVIFKAWTSGSSTSFSIRNVKITVFGVGGPAVTVSGSAGTMTAQNGYQYVFCYGNSNSGHVSSPTPPSNSTGPFTNKLNVAITLTASTDPQVNQIRVFRTTDGGGQPFFELPNSPFPNTSGNVTDNAVDSALQIANIAPLPKFNDPPPAGLLDPVWYAGRLWGHVANALFFASGPDITMGNGQEAWFPVYVFTLPTAIIRKFPLPNGMLVVTVDDIYVVRGIDTTSFTVNEFMRDIGMRNWNAADSDGSNIYLYTTDRQTLLINANGIQSISSNISDVVANVDPSAAYMTTFRYTARNTMLFLGDGTTNIYPYNLQQQAWCPIQTPAGGVQAIGAIETQLGVWQMLRGKNVAGQTVAQRSITNFTDEGTAFTCSATFGPIPLADMLMLAQVKDIAIATAAGQSAVTVSVLANEISGTFQGLGLPTSSEPPELSATPSQSFTANRYSLQNSALPELMNFIFMQLSWASAGTADELYAWALAGTQTTGGSALGPAGKLPELQGR